MEEAKPYDCKRNARVTDIILSHLLKFKYTKKVHDAAIILLVVRNQTHTTAFNLNKLFLLGIPSWL